MNVDDLNPGDILLFSGEKGSFISEAIMFLTGAPVSHAAMTYQPNSSIIEESPPAVQTNSASERFKGRKITVMRLDPPQADYDPVLAAAKGYLNDREPYAFSNLYLVGILLIYKKFTPNTLTQKITIKILKKLTAEILSFYNKHKNPEKLPMVCSQFVYQCYDDAGKDYRLNVRDGVLMAAKSDLNVHESLLDQAMSRARNDTSTAFRNSLEAISAKAEVVEPKDSDEDLAKELLEALQPSTALKAEAEIPLEDDLVVAIQEFSQAAHMLRTGATIPENELLQANTLRSPSASMAFLKAEEAYFVSPADLLQHCTNLKQVGEIVI